MNSFIAAGVRALRRQVPEDQDQCETILIPHCLFQARFCQKACPREGAGRGSIFIGSRFMYAVEAMRPERNEFALLNWNSKAG